MKLNIKNEPTFLFTYPQADIYWVWLIYKPLIVFTEGRTSECLYEENELT